MDTPRTGSSKCKAREGLSQASIPFTKPTNERRPSHPRSDFSHGDWRGNEGVSKSLCGGPLMETQGQRSDLLPILSSFMCSSLGAPPEELDRQLSG